ncbi:GmrSD restriction endonuclease domain-containing protein [Aphanothece minutissima]|uniref:GmrSD restriction endonucleases N-terminal domain-containing protein n=1 Tax=Aphanothece cf. minutissima CCALA 015 TaxID=2107695 RepID=A0ABX5F9S4_9CHRO|nr:DUF262 domain-containing protein [Aphanothece minutissima]PSB38496.1 hypothetical protein C7B81_02640 [Aphanothece cf. minutissima CCALA 015]
MAKAEATVEELVSKIERGELRLPEMQRRYVWRSTRVRDLLDSLYRGYPSGAILIWETDEPVPEQNFAVGQQDNPYAKTQLLLDGQQRLTSLSAVIRGEPVQVNGRVRPIELLFNLDHPDQLSVVTEVDDNTTDAIDEAAEAGDDGEEPIEEEADASDDELQKRFDRMTFVVSTRKLEQLPQWVKVSEVFKVDSDAPFLQRAGVTGFDDERYQKYSQRLARLRGIRKYVYRMDVLERSLSYDEVTEIFVRVNSLGAKLRSSDLALAQITAKWRGSLQVFQAYQADCTRIGFELDLGIHLKNLVAHATGQSRFLTVANLRLEQLRSGWDDGCRGLDFALNLLRSNAGITSPALLASPFLVISLGFYGAQRRYALSADEAAGLARWVLLANAKGRYSRGSSETLLDQDLKTMRDGGGYVELLERLRTQVGRLDITPEELAGRSQRSSLFKTMFLAFQQAGARDWQSQLAIALSHVGSAHQLQFHHIFPKALLRQHGYGTGEIDDIANLAFIGGRSNRRISDRPPATYIPELVASNVDQAFRSQCIPIDPALLALERYRTFMAERRRLIAERLNIFLSP